MITLHDNGVFLVNGVPCGDAPVSREALLADLRSRADG